MFYNVTPMPTFFSSLLEVLYRVRAAPTEHLGCKSLARLDVFHLGYSLFPFTIARDVKFDEFREWVIKQYRPSFGTAAMSASMILRNIVQDDARAFDVFFEALDSALAAHPGALSRSVVPRELNDQPPVPASAFLDALTEWPAMFLQPPSVGALRSFLDGYCLAAMEEGHFECLDLEGFEHWVRKELDLKGLFRWENAVITRFLGNEGRALEWALKGLKSYRLSKGALSGTRYEVRRIKDISEVTGGSSKT